MKYKVIEIKEGRVLVDDGNKIIATINHSANKDLPMVLVENEDHKNKKMAFLFLGACSFKVDSLNFNDIGDTMFNKVSDNNIIEFAKNKYHKSEHKGVYSEEDILDAFTAGVKFARDIENNPSNTEYLQSLNQEYIELETTTCNNCNKLPGQHLSPDCCHNYELQTDRIYGQLRAYVKTNK